MKGAKPAWVEVLVKVAVKLKVPPSRASVAAPERVTVGAASASRPS